MTAVVTDTDEPGWNRQQALAALAAVGRHLSDAGSLAAHLPDNSQHENLRTKLRHDVRRSVRTALKTAD